MSARNATRFTARCEVVQASWEGDNSYKLTMRLADASNTNTNVFDLKPNDIETHQCLRPLQYPGFPHAAVCHRGFSSASQRNAHIKAVHDLVPFVCPNDECRRLFHDGSNYDKHVRVCDKTPAGQASTKQYTCDTCGKVCGRSDNLRRHKRTHLKNAVRRRQEDVVASPPASSLPPTPPSSDGERWYNNMAGYAMPTAPLLQQQQNSQLAGPTTLDAGSAYTNEQTLGDPMNWQFTLPFEDQDAPMDFPGPLDHVGPPDANEFDTWALSPVPDYLYDFGTMDDIMVPNPDLEMFDLPAADFGIGPPDQQPVWAPTFALPGDDFSPAQVGAVPDATVDNIPADAMDFNGTPSQDASDEVSDDAGAMLDAFERELEKLRGEAYEQALDLQYFSDLPGTTFHQ